MIEAAPSGMEKATASMGRAADEPLVSIIIPCHNGAPTVGQTIDSALAQSYSRKEVVVVDDASADASWDVISEYGDAVIAIRNDRLRGACYSRNRGAALASGEFLMFLDADDRIEPNTIAALVDTMGAQDASLAAADWRFLMKSDGGWAAVDSGFSREPPGGDFVRAWLSGWYIPPCALLWRKTAFDATGGWDESLTANQDGDLVLRALLNGARIEQASGGLGLYRKEPGSQTTLSTTVSRESVASRLQVFRKVEEKLEASGLLESYRIDLGRAYYSLARQAYSVDIRSAEESQTRAWKLAGRGAPSGTLAHKFGAFLLGLRRKERLAKSMHSAIRALRSAAGRLPAVLW